jgi:hypothetical protein
MHVLCIEGQRSPNFTGMVPKFHRKYRNPKEDLDCRIVMYMCVNIFSFQTTGISMLLFTGRLDCAVW